MLTKLDCCVKRWREWCWRNPFSMFMGILIPAILLFVVYQLIFNPLDLIHDPWDAGGLKIGILVGIPSAIVGAILVWWHGRRKNDGK